MLVASTVVNRTLLQRLLGGCAFALALPYQREVFACLDVAYTAAATLAPSRRCRVNGAHRTRSTVGDQLEGRTLREARRYRRISEWRWRMRRVHHARRLARPVRLGRRKGEHVRFDWKGEEPPSNMHDVRAAAAPLALMLKWTTLFSHRFFAGKHVHLLELASLIGLLRRITREGIRTQRLLVLVDSRVVLGAVSKGRWSSRKFYFLLRKLGFCYLAYDIALELVWVPTWANPADALSRDKPIESWYASLPEFPPSLTAVLGSAHALSGAQA